MWPDISPASGAPVSFILVFTRLCPVFHISGLPPSASTRANSARLAFTSAIGLWGWHELSFLTGWISGPRTAPCPQDASEWRRFKLAAATLIYHELALALTAAAIVAVSWGQPNQVGCWIFLILLVSRLSAKFNLFLGVPNFSAEFFPDHLRYLTSYLRKRPMNALFPISIIAGMALGRAEAAAALEPGASAFAVVGFSLMFALTALAIIEHAFMILPLPDTALWRWAMPAAGKRGNAS